ncbi:PhzF family phenazine biosynthesis protein [Variovorax sp. VNK109]|uniref:PhzF family phenazine biosynthesis protein n=1 Tax=Variovorax sp. VNK109 TaxID=3400919 RepID=UPI003C0F3E06
MKLDYLHVSAFTGIPGQGNPAGVVWLDEWPSDETLSTIAKTIALPITACIVQVQDRLELRWLSRTGLFVQSMCGHGTLAASFAVSERNSQLPEFTFDTPGGAVRVEKRGDMFYLALPRWDSHIVASQPLLNEALRAVPAELRDAGRDLLAVFDDEQQVRQLEPDMAKLLKLGRRGFIATSPGESFDCVSRFFCPSFGLGVDEDPVTGSAHCAIAPYWSQRLNKTTLTAHQASPAGGDLTCEVTDTSVIIGSQASLLRVSVVTF